MDKLTSAGIGLIVWSHIIGLVTITGLSIYVIYKLYKKLNCQTGK